MTESTFARNAEPRSIATTPLLVQLLRLGLFGAGLGGAAIGFTAVALPRLMAEPATIMLLGAGILTAFSSCLLVHDTLIPTMARSKR